ncbi:Uncharacterised protein [Mycobacteroides abscessus subsp. abscessus]|nr:Uncharacterised protein [Mycobacteroides abscessus subsp. abscessus]
MRDGSQWLALKYALHNIVNDTDLYGVLDESPVAGFFIARGHVTPWRHSAAVLSSFDVVPES